MTFKINVRFRNIVHYLAVEAQHNLWNRAEWCEDISTRYVSEKATNYLWIVHVLYTDMTYFIKLKYQRDLRLKHGWVSIWGQGLPP